MSKWGREVYRKGEKTMVENKTETKFKEPFNISNLSEDMLRVFRNKKRGELYYYYELRFEQGKKKRFYGKTPNEVFDKLRAFYKQNRQMFSMAIDGDTHFFVLFERYIKEALKYYTYKVCRRMIYFSNREVKGSIIDVPLKDLNADLISDFYEELYQKYPFCAIEEMHKYICETIMYANSVNLMENLNVDRIIFPKEHLEPVVERFMSEMDRKKLMYLGMFDQGTEYSTIGIMVTLGLLTDIGVNTINKLNGDALDLERMTLRAKNVVRDINPEGYTWVRDAVKTGRISCDKNMPLVPNARKGRSASSVIIFYLSKMSQDALYRDDIESTDFVSSMAMTDILSGMSRGDVALKYDRNVQFVSTTKASYNKRLMYTEESTKHRDELYAIAKNNRDTKENVIPFSEDEQEDFED
jgi:hypothetical protein